MKFFPALSLAIMLGAASSADAGCPPKKNCLGDPAAWGAMFGDSPAAQQEQALARNAAQGATRYDTRGPEITTWSPDPDGSPDRTLCSEIRDGGSVTRQVRYLSSGYSTVNPHPTDAYWRAMGCERDHAATRAPATWDAVVAKIDRANEVETRREAQAAARGIKLCSKDEFLATPNDCMRRARMADRPE